MSVRPRVAALARAVYAELGAAAPGFSADAAVVRAHEAARAFGALALTAEEGGAPVEPDPALAAALAEAVRADATGWLVLYDVAAVVGPRLLTAFASARAGAAPDDDALLDAASALVTCEITEARAALPVDGDAAAWRAGSSEIDAALERAGLG